MKRELVKLPYPIDEKRLINIVNITLLEGESKRYLSFGIKYSNNIKIMALKLFVSAKNRFEQVVFEKELMYKKGPEKGEIINEEIELPLEGEFGEIYVLSIVDENIVSYINQGIYSFATYERIIYELRGGQANPYPPQASKQVAPPLAFKKQVEPVKNVIKEPINQNENKATGKGAKIAYIVIISTALALSLVFILIFVGKMVLNK